MRVLVLDNYDSFTWNLVQSIESQGATCVVVRSDAIELEEILRLDLDRIVLSPGPFGPERSGICPEVVRRVSPAVPTLGVCLGMQVIAVSAGASVVPSGRPVHGKSRRVTHDGRGVLRGLPSPFDAGLYHSLIVDPGTVPEQLLITARDEDGTIMGCRIQGRPVHGLLFHPESFLTPLGDRILKTFLEGADVV